MKKGNGSVIEEGLFHNIFEFLEASEQLNKDFDFIKLKEHDSEGWE